MEKLIQDTYRLLGLRLNPRQTAALERYEQELIDWSQRINLTTIRDPDGIRTKHFLDSLTCLLALRESPPSHLVDVGSGAGFPGIPLKIACPSMKVTLVESVGKKVEFCRHVVRTLGLEGIEVIHARAEDVGHMANHREAYDWAVARAVASLPVLVEYLLPLVRLGGHALALKGAAGPVEAQQAEGAIQILGGRLRRLIPISLPGVAEERYLVVIDKVAATPEMYPRKAGIPVKRPLR